MKTLEQIMDELPPERRKRIEEMAETYKMTVEEAFRETAMAEWQNSLDQQQGRTSE